ncbi:MAG: hypothetical protein KBD63_04400 [Bacteriovoracaceae bacterium]|nr:hypothetical protein [Bacteriovoracaceae bacterium]
MNQNGQYIPLFIASIIFYVLVLNMALLFIIKPNFIFSRLKENHPFKKYSNYLNVGSYVALFLASFWLGLMSYLIKMFNVAVF